MQSTVYLNKDKYATAKSDGKEGKYKIHINLKTRLMDDVVD